VPGDADVMLTDKQSTFEHLGVEHSAVTLDRLLGQRPPLALPARSV